MDFMKPPLFQPGREGTARGLGQAEEANKPAPIEGGLFLAGLELLHLPPAQDHRRTQGQKAPAQHQARARKGEYGSQ
jgi:hypothetical protein